MEIRKIRIEDAKKFLEMALQLDKETKDMMLFELNLFEFKIWYYIGNIIKGVNYGGNH